MEELVSLIICVIVGYLIVFGVIHANLHDDREWIAAGYSGWFAFFWPIWVAVMFLMFVWEMLSKLFKWLDEKLI